MAYRWRSKPDGVETTVGCGFLLLWLIGILASIGLPIVVIIAAVHFLRKFW